MTEKVLNFMDSSDMLRDASLILVCVSGGVDSMVLLHILRDISKKRGFDVNAAHFNHQLRGGESDRDEDFVREFCRTEGIPFYLGSVDVRNFAKINKLGIEEAARNLRYEFFEKTASEIGANLIATGHNADDNAETILFNLTRGTGPKGICGIPPKRDNIIRPILHISREQILEYAHDCGIPYVYDSTNKNTDYSRNNIRLNVIPILKKINPGFVKSASCAAALMRADEDYLSEVAERFIEGQTRNGNGSISVSASELLSLPPAISGRVVRKLYGGNLFYSQYTEIMKLCSAKNPSATLNLPNAIVRREYSHIIFNKICAKNAVSFEPFSLTECEFFEIHEIALNISCKSVLFSDRIEQSMTTFLFKSSEICGKMLCRPRREGDKTRIFGRNVSKSLKKLFIEHQIPKHKRNLIPVISDGIGILAVFGVCRSDRAIPQDGDMCILMEFSHINSLTE